MFKPKQFGRTCWVLRDDRGASPAGAPTFKTARDAKRWLAENAASTNAADNCAAGMHSWIDEVGKLPADTACTRCGDLYGDPA